MGLTEQEGFSWVDACLNCKTRVCVDDAVELVCYENGTELLLITGMRCSCCWCYCGEIGLNQEQEIDK